MNQSLHAAIGTRLTGLRTDRGWTVENLAIASDVPAIDIARHEAGKPIPIERLWRFSKALRVSITAFFTDSCPVDRAVTATIASVEEGLALMVAFRAIEDAHLRAVLLDIADHFTRCSES